MQILNISGILSEPILNLKRPRVWITARNSFIGRNILEQLDYDFIATTHKDNTWYGKSKRIISMIIKEDPNMINLKCYGVWGKYEKPDRFPTTCIMSDEITIEDKLMRYIHVDELVKIVDMINKKWPKTKREVTIGEPILLSKFAKQLNPNIKVIIKGKGKDYI